MSRLILSLFLAVAALSLRAQDDVRIEHFDEADGFAESRVTCVIQDRQGLIWFSTWDGLYRYNGYRLRSYKARPGDNCPLEINRIDYIRELPSGGILCRVRDRYYTFDKLSGKFEVYSGKRESRDIRYMPDGKTVKLVKSIGRYADIPVRVMYTDRQGGIWVHSNLGLDRITSVRKPIPTRKVGDESEELVRGLMEDSRQRLWVADKNGYLRLADSHGATIGYVAADGSVSRQRRKFGHSVYCMHEDRRGNVWIGTKFSGLFLFRPAGSGYSVIRYTAGSPASGGLSHNDIYSIAEDAYGRIWIGTYGGGLNMTTADGHGRLRFVSSASGMPRLHGGKVEIHCLLITAGGVLMAGTNSGLYTARIERDPRRMVFHNNRRDPADATSLSNNRVMDIISTRSGIYVATYGGGVCRVMSDNLLSDTLRFRPYTTENGLSSDVVISAVEDRRGNIWTVSGASLSRMDPRSEVFTNYKRSTFSGGFLFSEVHPLCTAGGRLVIGTTQGTLEFSPDDLRKSSYVPPIVTSCADRVELSPGEKRLAIDIAALDYDKNEQIEYAYRLDGIDSGWNYTTDNRIIYANIPAGTYTLRIKSTNGDGIWTDNERVIEVHRTPRFNETPAAWMLYGGLLLVAAWAVFRTLAYIRRLQREISSIKLTMNEKIEYVLLKSGEKNAPDPGDGGGQAVSADCDRRFAERVTRFVEENYANAGMTVTDFAQAMGMSRSVLYLNMKRVFGSTPNNFIQDTRINHAKRMIRERQDNISEVAYKCGFSDPKYFSRCFKKATGTNPKEYQKGADA